MIGRVGWGSGVGQCRMGRDGMEWGCQIGRKEGGDKRGWGCKVRGRVYEKG